MLAGLHYQKFWVEICFIRVIGRTQYPAVLKQTPHLWVTSSQSSPKPSLITEVLCSQNILHLQIHAWIKSSSTHAAPLFLLLFIIILIIFLLLLYTYFLIILGFTLLGIESRALYILGKSSTSEMQLQFFSLYLCWDRISHSCPI